MQDEYPEYPYYSLFFEFLMSFPFSVTAQLKTGNCWKEADGIFIPVPPGEHPRLYLREAHARQMGARLNDSILKPVVEKLRSQAARSPQLKIEWDALQYLVSGDPRTGRAIIDSALALLKRTELPERQDAARVTGRMMVTRYCL